MSAEPISMMYRLWLMLRSALFWVWMFSTTAFFAIPALLGSLISFEAAYKVCDVWVASNMWGLRLICGVKWEVIGKENIPEQPCLLVSKHQSTWETFFYAHYLTHVLYVAKRSLGYIPVFGWMIVLLGFVMIDRKLGRSALQQMIEQSKQKVALKRWVVIFPEGTRMPVGSEPIYRPGAFKVSVQAQIPIMPVAMNSGEFWPRLGFIKWPGTVTVVFGPVIHPENKTAEDLRDEVQTWIEGEMEKITVIDRFPY